MRTQNPDPTAVENQAKLLFSIHRCGAVPNHHIWEKQPNMVRDQWLKVAEDILIAGYHVVRRDAQDEK